MSTELVTREQRDTPDALIALAIEHGQPVTELMQMRRQWKLEQAEEAYCSAMAEFQRRCPVIGKNRQAGQGNFGYQFANLEDIMAAAGPILADLGISVSFSSEQADRAIKITCKISKGIHSEQHFMTVPIPDMKVNSTQQMGAALSYARRYALCGALNIVVGDEDTDATGLGTTISDEDIACLNDWLSNTDTKLDRFLKWAGVDSLANFPAAKMDEAIAFLKAKGRR